MKVTLKCTRLIYLNDEAYSILPGKVVTPMLAKP